MSNTPTPDFIFETLTAYQRSHALRAAIELDLFSAIARGHDTSAKLATRCRAAERGVRILCDTLVVLGLLTKTGERYGLSEVAATFLDRERPGYLGASVSFLMSPVLMEAFETLTDAVRKGETATEGDRTTVDHHEVWVEFARGMAARMAPTAEALAKLIAKEPVPVRRVLDIAAGHGLFGIELARRNPGAEIVALDWPAVLEVAEENARAAGVSARFRTLPGDALEIDLGRDYDLVLFTNFLHHFDPERCMKILRRTHAALAPRGHAVTLEYVPNEDRVSPPHPAAFALVMLATTRGGDAYPFSEYERMFKDAGFSSSRMMDLEGSLERVIVSRK